MSADKQWFLYMPASGVLKKFDSKEQMEAETPVLLQDNYCDDAWDDEVIFAICGLAAYTDLARKPDESFGDYNDRLEEFKTHEIKQEIIEKKSDYYNDDGELKDPDEEWPYDDDWEYICRFAPLEIEQKVITP